MAQQAGRGRCGSASRRTSRHRIRVPVGDIVVDVTLYGLKRGQAPPPIPENLDAPPSDAELFKILGVQKAAGFG